MSASFEIALDQNAPGYFVRQRVNSSQSAPQSRCPCPDAVKVVLCFVPAPGGVGTKKAAAARRVELCFVPAPGGVGTKDAAAARSCRALLCARSRRG